MVPIYNPPAAAAAAAGWTKYDGALEEFFPSNAVAGAASTTGRAWTWSGYTQLTAGVGLIFIPHILHTTFRAAAVTAGTQVITVEVEIATGAAGAEVTYARFSDTFGFYSTPAGAIALVATSKSWPCGPAAIPYNTRISFRIRASIAATLAVCAVTLYLGGYFTTAPASYTRPPLDGYLGGLSSLRLTTIPSGSFQSVTPGTWGSWGSWYTIIDPAPHILLVWGCTYNDPSISTRARYLEFGTGAAGSETSRGRLAIPGGLFPANNGVQLMRRPVFVNSGARLAVRATGTTAAMNHQWLYEELFAA